MVATVAASVVVGGAIVTIATLSDESPRDVTRQVSPGVDVTDTDGVLSGDKTANLRTLIESSMVQGGEPYTQEDVDRELAELLELTGGSDMISIVIDDGR
ncbi:hypothetical protein [Georgenia satyanarayanai]|uniref:hypothetical protein n=1 Tax=Georgenia satyanarayanai TaxID=860221 RepID=UPI001265A273|nr:hypothetical protein [Georgenia satyanarayanai]